MTHDDIEYYFRPQAIKVETTTMSAPVFNLYRLLLLKAKVNCVFVPIRSIQYQAVVTDEEVIFIDALRGHAVDHKGNGGRMIDLAWHWDNHARDSLSAPVSLNITFYRNDLEGIQRQLVGLFPAALQAKLDALDGTSSTAEHCHIHHPKLSNSFL